MLTAALTPHKNLALVKSHYAPIDDALRCPLDPGCFFISSTLAIYLSSSIICHSLKNTFDLFFTLWDMIYFVTIRYSIVHMLLLTFPDRDASLLIFLTVTFPVSDCDKGRCKYNHSLKPNPFLPAKESSEHVLGLVFKSSAQPHV